MVVSEGNEYDYIVRYFPIALLFGSLDDCVVKKGQSGDKVINLAAGEDAKESPSLLLVAG